MLSEQASPSCGNFSLILNKLSFFAVETRDMFNEDPTRIGRFTDGP